MTALDGAFDGPLRPLLARYPDARRANVPLFEPVLLPFVALMFGAPAAGALAAYNAIALRRWARAAAAIAIGIAGWLAFVFIIVVSDSLITHNARLVILIGRAMHFLLGAVLYLQQRRIVTGHEFLAGRMVPMRASYLLAFALQFVIPGALLALMLGVPPGR